MSFNELNVEEAALSWFGELSYAVVSTPHLAPGELVRRAQFVRRRSSRQSAVDTIARLNPAIPTDAREEGLRKAVTAREQSRVSLHAARWCSSSIAGRTEVSRPTTFG